MQLRRRMSSLNHCLELRWRRRGTTETSQNEFHKVILSGFPAALFHKHYSVSGDDWASSKIIRFKIGDHQWNREDSTFTRGDSAGL
jgi:hypothetical protein